MMRAALMSRSKRVEPDGQVHSRLTWSRHNGQREACSVVQTLEVAVKALMRSDHQQLDRLWVQNAIGKQAQLVVHILPGLKTGDSYGAQTASV